jgi:hypothetical protein
MNWNDEGHVIARVVDDMRRRGVPATAEQVANALRTPSAGLPRVSIADACALVKQAGRAVEGMLATLGTRSRVAEIEAEVVKEGCLGYVDETGRVGVVYVPPAPAPGRRGEPNSSEGDVPRQLSTAQELAELKVEATRLQQIVDSPSAPAVEKQRAQAALDPILILIQVLDAALRPPQTGGQLYAEPDPYWRKPKEEA